MFIYALDFIWAVRRHWGSLVTGGCFIGVISLWQSTGHYVRPGVYWSIAIIALFVACYKAWAEERKAKELAQQQLHIQQEPRLYQEYWLNLCKEKAQLEEELDSLELPEPSPSLKDSPIDVLPSWEQARLMTNSEYRESQKRDRRINRIKDKLRLLDDRLNTVTKISLYKQ
jgi:hypothetical protein